MDRGYQNGFSIGNEALFDVVVRENKAKTAIAILDEVLDEELKNCRLLDVGASTGIIDNYLSNYLGHVTGIDIDEAAISYAGKTFRNENLTFQIGDAMKLDFPNENFDVVVCAHVYEHVPDAFIMFEEIYRVLKPGGVCYFSAGNRLMLNEPHYNLKFLSIMPRFFAHIYLRLLGRGSFYYEKHLTYWGLRKLSTRFTLEDYTVKLIKAPKKYRIDYMLKENSFKQALAGFIARYLYWFLPGYIWVLKKPSK